MRIQLVKDQVMGCDGFSIHERGSLCMHFSGLHLTVKLHETKDTKRKWSLLRCSSLVCV